MKLTGQLLLAMSFNSDTILKNSTVSSRVGSRPSWKYGGILIPRRTNVLMGPYLRAKSPMKVVHLMISVRRRLGQDAHGAFPKKSLPLEFLWRGFFREGPVMGSS